MESGRGRASSGGEPLNQQQNNIRADDANHWSAGLSRVFRFGLAGFASLGIVLGVTSGGVAVGLETHLAYVVALCTAIVTNFVICRWLIFKTQDQPLGAEFVRFVASVGIWRVVEFAGFVVLFDWLGVAYQLAVIGLAMVMFAVKYIWCRIFVFREVKSDDAGGVAI